MNIKKMKIWILSATILISLSDGFVQQPSGKGSSLPAYADEPLKYIGSVQSDKRFYDGAIRHAVGIHHYQVVRANRTHPPEGGKVGWTYSHQPYLAYWNGKFYLQYLSGQVQEHTPPTRTLICSSADGRRWSAPMVVFPEYELPEINTTEGTLPAGTKSVMHQRMGFYVAPNGRLLTLAFYSYCLTPRLSPNTGDGIGRVVREIYQDGSFGPIYFIRYNRQAGFDENNTNFPFYKKSNDKGFREACEALLADKLVTLQWWEEDRGNDGFFAIDPSNVGDASQEVGKVTTSAGAGKALCFFHRPDGVVVSIWKNQWSGLSPDNGKTWTTLVKNRTLMTCGAKVWGQRTSDGKYAIVYNHSLTRRNRFPMVIMSSPDGHLLEDMLCWQGEVPPKRYQGIHKNPGSQYIRGIVEGNGVSPGPYMWNTYSMNKEDIWVTRTRIPITAKVIENVNENFEQCQDESALEYWNLYMPRWAPVKIGISSDQKNKFLELVDEEPYDYALVERAFPVSQIVEVQFRVNIHQIDQGHALEVEVVNEQGKRPMRLRFDKNWLGLDIAQVFPLQPVPITTNKWYTITLRLDCTTGSYALALDSEWIRRDLAFAEKVDSLERIIFRSGPYRGEVPATIAARGADKPAGLDTEDLPGADEKVAVCHYWIDDLTVKKLE